MACAAPCCSLALWSVVSPTQWLNFLPLKHQKSDYQDIYKEQKKQFVTFDFSRFLLLQWLSLVLIADVSTVLSTVLENNCSLRAAQGFCAWMPFEELYKKKKEKEMLSLFGVQHLQHSTISQHIQYWCYEDRRMSSVNSNSGWQGWIISHRTFLGWPFQSSVWVAVMWKADGRESDSGSEGGEQRPVAPAPVRVLWISNGSLIYHKRCA